MKRLALAAVLLFTAPVLADPVLEDAAKLRHGGDLNGARARLEEALKSGESAEVRAELGSVLLEMGQPADAEPHLSVALDLQPAADTAFNLAIARFRLKAWDGAWSACLLCLKWSEKGSRLQERAAEIGYAIAKRLEERVDREAAYAEIARWAPETDGGREAAAEIK